MSFLLREKNSGRAAGFAVGLFACVVVSGAPIPSGDDPEVRKKGFFGNPNERMERAEREEEYREYYEQTFSRSLNEREMLQQFFAPRIYDEAFDTNLPGRQNRGQIGLSLNPKFSDFIREEFVRFPIGISYDFSNWFEATTDVGTYFGNPFDNGGDSGIYNWRIGAKYSWIGVAGTDYSIAVGARADMPLSNPPLELTDGFARYEPYVSISKQLEKHPRWLLYLNLAYQAVNATPFRAKQVSPQPRDRQFLRPGAIYYPGGHFRYSLEVEYRTNALDFREDYTHIESIPDPLPEHSRYSNWVLASKEVHEVILYPAVTWFPTREIREGFIIPGNWDIGIRLDLPLVEETGEDIGLSVRLRWYYDYRKFIAQDLHRFFSSRRD